MKKLPEGEKTNFLLFFITYFTLSLSPYGKKPNHLLFPPFLSPQIGKPEAKTFQKKFYFFFFIIYFTFSLSPYEKKTKPLTFSALFITGNRKTASENFQLKFFFFFFFFTFLLPTAPRNRKKNYHLPFFFLKFRLKVPKTAAKRAQVSFFTNYIFSAVITRKHTPTHINSVFPTHNA